MSKLTEKYIIKQRKIIEDLMYPKKKWNPKKGEGVWSYIMRVVK